MGTNFYATFPSRERTLWPPGLPEDERLHIGKRSSLGGGRVQFIWAMDPVLFLLSLTSAARWGIEPIEEISAEDFVIMLTGAAQQDYTQVGRGFS